MPIPAPWPIIPIGRSAGPTTPACSYTLNRPNATNAATATYNNTQVAADSVWTQLYTVANPAAGHWELIVDMSSAGRAATTSTATASAPMTARRAPAAPSSPFTPNPSCRSA